MRGATLLIGLLLVAGCAAPAPDGLRATLEQSRDNENRHLLQVVLANDGAAPVEVVRLQVRSPGFTEVPPTVRPDVVRPGRRLAFPVTYGPAVCGAASSAEVVVGLRTRDGLQDVRLQVGESVLTRVQDRECALRGLAETVRVAFAPDWERRGDQAHGRMVLERRTRDVRVRLTGLEGTVLLTLRPGPLPVELGAGRVEVPVVVTASRCDPHALTESKRTYDFPYYVQLGDDPPLYATARPDGPGRAVLEQVLRDTCRRLNGS